MGFFERFSWINSFLLALRYYHPFKFHQNQSNRRKFQKVNEYSFSLFLSIVMLFVENEGSENHKQAEKPPLVSNRSQQSSLSKISNRSTVNKMNITSELLRVCSHFFKSTRINFLFHRH